MLDESHKKRVEGIILLSIIFIFLLGIIAGIMIRDLQWSNSIMNQNIFHYDNNYYLITKVNSSEFKKVTSIIDYGNSQIAMGNLSFEFKLPDGYYIESNQLRFDFNKDTKDKVYKVTRIDENLIKD